MKHSTAPLRQVRATFDAHSIVVYQAYPPAIAQAALTAGRFVSPFRFERMTWVKPSFLWMMYRCGWSTKPGQERVLAVTITREGFEWALANSCLSHYDPAVYPSKQVWADRKTTSPVRVQWDPERDLDLKPLLHRTIQIGLSGPAARNYVDDWTLHLVDVTDLARDIQRLAATGRSTEAVNMLPEEQPYPLPEPTRKIVGGS